MAATEVEVHSEPLKFKTWVLKVSIHCEGCKKKVKKIINSVPGVYNIDIDAKQHRVVVTGNVEADALLRKLLKAGKHAELLLPDKPTQEEKYPDKAPAIKKDEPKSEEDHGNSSKEIPQAKKVKQPPPATSKPEAPPAQGSTKTNHIAAGEGGAANSAKNIEDTSACRASGSGGAKVTDAAGKTAGAVKVVESSKVEEKKPETDPAGKQTSPPSVEVKGGVTESLCAEKSGGGNVGKKKKKKGQNGNSVVAEPSSALPASAGSPNDNGGPPTPTMSSNDSPPRHHYGYDYPSQGPPPSHYYAPPPAPVYAVNYNTAQPSSSYAASYYASPPPQSYAYAYPGLEMGPPPSDYDLYPRQPLDSFEMFSDENPNGCWVM